MKKYALIAVLTAALCLNSACSKPVIPQSGSQDANGSDENVSSIVTLQEPFHIEQDSDVYTALNQLMPDLGINGTAEDSFRQDYTDRNTVRKFYRVKQQCSGIDIYGAGITFSVDSSGMSDCYIDETVSAEMSDSTADLSVEVAKQKIPDCLDGAELRSADYLGTVYYPHSSGGYRLSYSFYVNSASEDGSGFTGTIYLDADTGELLGSEIGAIAADTVLRKSASLKNMNNKPLQYHVRLHTNGEIEYSDDVNRIYILDAKKKPISVAEMDDYMDLRFSGFSGAYYARDKDTDNMFKKALEFTEKTYDYYKSMGLDGFHNYDDIPDPGNIYIIMNETSDETKKGSAVSYPYYSWIMNTALIKVSPSSSSRITLDLVGHEYTLSHRIKA